MGDSIGDILSVSITPLLQSLQGMAGVFVGTGYIFLSIAIVLSVLGGMYTWWASGSLEDLVSNGVRTVIVVAPLLILLSAWPQYMKDFFDFFKDLPQQLGMTSGDSAKIVGESIQKIMDAGKAEPLNAEDAKKSWLQALSDTFSMKMIYGLMLSLIVFILNALLAFAILFAVFMPLASLYIGAIFGPLILAWMPWKPLSDMTARWTGFMIANGLSFVVAMAIMSAMATTIEGLSKTMNGMSEQSAMVGLAGYLVTLVAVAATYLFSMNLMLQANNIAQGMTGGTSIGEGLFGKISAAMAAGGMGKLAKGGLGGSGKAAQTGISAGGSGLKAAGNTMGTKAADMLNKGGGSLGNRASGSVLAGAASISYGIGHVASKAGPALGMGVRDAAKAAGGAASKAAHATASGAGKLAGDTANVAAAGAQKAIDSAKKT